MGIGHGRVQAAMPQEQLNCSSICSGCSNRDWWAGSLPHDCHPAEKTAAAAGAHKSEQTALGAMAEMAKANRRVHLSEEPYALAITLCTLLALKYHRAFTAE